MRPLYKTVIVAWSKREINYLDEVIESISNLLDADGQSGAVCIAEEEMVDEPEHDLSWDLGFAEYFEEVDEFNKPPTEAHSSID